MGCGNRVKFIAYFQLDIRFTSEKYRQIFAINNTLGETFTNKYLHIPMQHHKLVIALISIAVLSMVLYGNSPSEGSLSEKFEQWKKDHNKGSDYSQAEELFRLKAFEASLQEIEAHNSLLGRSFDMGLNQFSDLTKEQFAAQYLTQIESNPDFAEVEEDDENVGVNIDWVSYGAVSPVKYQGNCVASYAFSAVGAIEGVSVIFFRNQQEYSVQQVVDCSSGYGNNGCYNGRMDNTFNYVRAVGINTWNAYPYTASPGNCKVTSGIFRVNGSVPVSDCNSLENALFARPVSVVVDGQNMQNYRSGIFGSCGTNLSLPVLLVGKTDSYWTLKNSWGTAWGENGYIRIFRGNTCGVCQAGVYPIV